MKPRDYLYGCVILLTVVRISRQEDPCKLAKIFPNLHQRDISNKAPPHTCLEDTYIIEGWYGEPGVEIPTEPPKYLHCGTEYPVYIHEFLNGSDTGGIQKAIIHLRHDSGSMRILEAIQTKWCINTNKDKYRIYYLKKIPSACSAYCVESVNKDNGAIPIYMYETRVDVTVGLTSDLLFNKMVFYCNFEQSEKVLWYTVTWYIENKQIYTTQPVRKSPNLLKQTALHEKQIKDSGTDRVGFKVRCSFRASLNRSSSKTLPIRSKDKFIGIEIITPTIDVIVGGTTQLAVRATAPLACNSGRSSCNLDVHVFNNDAASCDPVPSVTNCKMEVKHNKWNHRTHMDVHADKGAYHTNGVTLTYIQLKTIENHRPHDFWQNVTIGNVTVRITYNSSEIEGRTCHALSDPRMKTFTGKHYNLLIGGIFTLFRNTFLQQEVQIKTQHCGTWDKTAYCTCGLIVRAGRQVYEINVCGGKKSFEYKRCDDVEGVFDVNVHGSTHTITFSSKTYLTIETKSYHTETYKWHINVHIYPSTLDVDKADGLCGKLYKVNGKGAFKPRERPTNQWWLWSTKVLHYHTDSFSESWRVPDINNLFNPDTRKLLSIASHAVYPCSCPIKQAGPEITCRGVHKNCSTILAYTKSTTCKLGKIQKRHATHQFVHNDRKQHKYVEKREAPVGWKNGWTEEKAKEYCSQLFNRSRAVQLCAQVPYVDQIGPLAICIADIKLLGDTSFASDGVESIKNQCYHEVESSKSLQVSAPGTRSIFQQIKEVACVNECSDHGVCTNGTCNCEEDYGGVDCSVNIREAPLLDHIFNDGYCTQHDDCQEISVYGETFLDTGNTHCKVRAKEIFENGVIQDAGEYKHQAYVESIVEAICTLPKSRKKNATVIIPEKSSVKVYYISVTNDGNAYSTESPVVVFNSVCQYCNIDGVKVDCSIVEGYCVSGTGCYSNGESLVNNDCYTCFVNGTSSAWIYSRGYRCQDLATTQTPGTSTNAESRPPVSSIKADPTLNHHVSVSEESRPLWIIGVVLGVAALICLLAFVLICKRKMIKNKKYKVDASTIDLKKGDSLPPLSYTNQTYMYEE